MYKVAAIQMASGSNLNANLTQAANFVTEAAVQGAKLIVLPENFALMAKEPLENFEISEKLGNGPIQDWISQLAANLGIWLVAGTIPITAEKPRKYYAASLVFDDNGNCVGRYDKMHLFDVTVSADEQYHESETIEAGKQIVVIDSPYGRLGLAICYDLRFPELFRCMLDQGVELIVVPSAFTAATGQAHWEILVRTRAVENLCYLIAANQGGYHTNGRETYGNSMIVDPWGIILNRLEQGMGVVNANLELEKQANLRQKFPAHKHRKIQCQFYNLGLTH